MKQPSPYSGDEHGKKSRPHDHSDNYGGPPRKEASRAKNPKEKVLEVLNTLEWKTDGSGIYADTTIPDIRGFRRGVSLHLGVSIVPEDIDDGAYRIHCYTRDLPKLAHDGLKFPGSDKLQIGPVPQR
jgi:hypothetical protein